METTIKWNSFEQVKPESNQICLVAQWKIEGGKVVKEVVVREFFEEKERFYGNADCVVEFWAEVPKYPSVA